jgi:hypothetical protein
VNNIRSGLPLLSIKDDISKFPHLTKYFAQYLATIERDDDSIREICAIVLSSKGSGLDWKTEERQVCKIA